MTKDKRPSATYGIHTVSDGSRTMHFDPPVKITGKDKIAFIVKEDGTLGVRVGEQDFWALSEHG